MTIYYIHLIMIKNSFFSTNLIIIIHNNYFISQKLNKQILNIENKIIKTNKITTNLEIEINSLFIIKLNKY